MKTNETNHTPGPWHVVKTCDPSALWHLAICGLRSTTDTRTTTIAMIRDSEANARLIAAAPELLEALEALVVQEDWHGEDVPPESPIGKARAAIAKARGQA